MDAFEVIGAFVDRERVDPEALKEALSTDEGRQYLVDVAMLREITSEQAPPVASITKPRRGVSRLAMAATLAAAVFGGYMAGRVNVVSPVGSESQNVSLAPLQTPAIPEPPPPTDVIQLDWHEGAGS